ncbi:hypothetical protein BGZ65_009997 [Modicella reniformis]|uniref:Uncharacterized protein n=1 Tax=Modicella reniformis TaxID=1440133 RepID=A0A9P6SV83_9FUNG|nr:hypothetical protein BGZ65_009997 [Modicella reniformis]
MAATATISTSTMLPVVGRATVNLDGTSSPPTTPPATPTSPVMMASDAVKAAAADPSAETGAPVEVEVEMVATPPPSPPPAPVSTALPPVTPFPSTSISDDSLSGQIDEVLDNNNAGHLLSTEDLTLLVLTESASIQTELSVVSSITEGSSPSTDATTFFDDMINAPQPPANILTLSPTTSIPDLYHDFFENHPELYDAEQSSDLEMDLDPDDYSPAVIRARTMAELRQTSVSAIQAPLIADRPKLETIDTINLMLHHHSESCGNGLQPLTARVHNGALYGLQHSQYGSDDGSATQRSQRKKKVNRA